MGAGWHWYRDRAVSWPAVLLAGAVLAGFVHTGVFRLGPLGWLQIGVGTVAALVIVGRSLWRLRPEATA